MSNSEITFEVFTLEPEDSGQVSHVVSDDVALPEDFEGYRRSSQDVMVAAVDRKGIIIGMGGGWVYEHAEKGPLLWVKAAEVNEPFEGTNLSKELISILLKFTEERGFAGVYLADVMARIVRDDSGTTADGGGEDDA